MKFLKAHLRASEGSGSLAFLIKDVLVTLQTIKPAVEVADPTKMEKCSF